VSASPGGPRQLRLAAWPGAGRPGAAVVWGLGAVQGRERRGRRRGRSCQTGDCRRRRPV